jgi:hypothetical protein
MRAHERVLYVEAVFPEMRRLVHEPLDLMGAEV